MSVNDIKLYSGVKEVVKLINDLRDCGVEKLDIDLPKIVVLGSQSSGKSSLLEQIVELDFLPRGTGTVTRCPLEIRIQNVTTESKKAGQVFFNDYNPEEIIRETKDKDPEFSKKIKDKINEITVRITGDETSIVDTPIKLTILSDRILSLTLIDLPGITRNSTGTKNIEDVTTNMAKKYISEQRSIILCVIPINTDISNSESLKLARLADPEGERTIGVLTKIDLQDAGTDCKDELDNKKFTLKHGYVGVKCRSQKDINENVTVMQALRNEKQFFAVHDIYKNMPSKTGTANLTNTLAKLFDRSIRQNLGKIVQEIDEKLEEQRELAKDLGEALPKDVSEKTTYLSIKLTYIYEEFLRLMEGKIKQSERSKLHKSLQGEFVGNQHIRRLYFSLHEKINSVSISIHKTITMDHIWREMQKHQELDQGFTSFSAYEQLISTYVSNYWKPQVVLLDEIFEYLKIIVREAIKTKTPNQDNIRIEFENLSGYFLNKSRERAEDILKSIHESEKNVIFQSNYSMAQHQQNGFSRRAGQQFHSSIGQIIRADRFMEQNIGTIMAYTKNPSPNSHLVNLDTQEQAKRERVFEFTAYIDQYLSILNNHISERVPKIIENFLVRLFTSDFKNLREYIATQKDFIKNLKEDPQVKTLRTQYNDDIEKLSLAQTQLRNLPQNKQTLD